MKKSAFYKSRNSKAIILFLLPTILGLILFQYIPLLNALRNSFLNVNLLAPGQDTFAGLSNYIRMAHDQRFLKSLMNTGLYASLKIVVQVPISLALALLVQQKIRGISFVRSALFAPTVTALSIVAVIWNLMYDPVYGFFNTVLQSFGISPQPFLTSPNQALLSITAMSIWQDVGYTMLIFLSGLQSIPDDYYEVAQIDGAGKIQLLRYITLPLLQRTTLFAIMTTTIFAFKVFTPIYIMTKGGPYFSTLVSVYYIFERGFIYLDMGYASALAVILVSMVLLLALIQNRLIQAQFEY